ncbi:MAG: hypothetical protein WBW60_10045 [Candidatus Sulfotelmatobacter sp.]
MTYPRFFRVVHTSLLVLLTISLQSIAQAQGAKKPLPETPIRDADAGHEEERSDWFLHGRVLPGKSSAELRHRAYQTKMQARAVRLARAHAVAQPASDAPLSGNSHFSDQRNQFLGSAYQIAVQGSSGSTNNSYPVQFNVGDYSISGTQVLSTAPGGQVKANLAFASLDFYSGQVNATCDATALSGTQCTLTPQNPITIGSTATVPATATINVPNNAIPAAYSINVNKQDVTGAPSHSETIVLTVNQDFTIGSLTPATQTINSGQSASYNFSVLPVGASFAGAVTLSCSGGPVISLCSFTPNPVTPGTSSAAVVMNIATTASSSSSSRAPFFYALGLALPSLALLGIRGHGREGKNFALVASILGLFVLALLLTSCGGGGSNGGSGGGGQQQGTQPGTYMIVVTGTSGTLSHQSASTATLIVNQ